MESLELIQNLEEKVLKQKELDQEISEQREELAKDIFQKAQYILSHYQRERYSYQLNKKTKGISIYYSNFWDNFISLNSIGIEFSGNRVFLAKGNDENLTMQNFDYSKEWILVLEHCYHQTRLKEVKERLKEK